jgi:DNA-binding MarR family transcriptional regulator
MGIVRKKSSAADWKSVPFNVDNSLLFKMVRLTNYMSRHYKHDPVKHFGLSARDWRIMLAIAAHQGSTAATISKFTGYDQMSVGRTVAKLVRQKRVRRVQNPSDRRETFLYLTDEAWESYVTTAKLIQDFEQDILSVLSSSQRKSLDKIFARLTERTINYTP